MVAYRSKSSPIETLESFFQCFNAKDLESLDEIWDSPCVFIIGNKTSLFNKYRNAVDFEKMVAGGWRSSSVNHSEIIFEDLAIAMVQLNFSRFDHDSTEIGRYDVSHLMVNTESGWRIKILYMNNGEGMDGIS